MTVDRSISSNVAGTTAFDRFLQTGRIVAGFAMLGSIIAGVSLVWIPAFASTDVHVVGGAVGALVGVVLNARHLI